MSLPINQQNAPSKRYTTGEMFAMFDETGKELTKNQKSTNDQKAFGFSAEGQMIRSNEAFNSGTGAALARNFEEDQNQEEKEREVARALNTYQIASRNLWNNVSSNVSIEIDNFIKERSQNREVLTSTRLEKSIVEKELPAANENVSIEGKKLFRSAEAQSIANLEKNQAEKALESANEQIADAREAGDVADLRNGYYKQYGQSRIVAEAQVKEEKLEQETAESSNRYDAAVRHRDNLGKTLDHLEKQITELEEKDAHLANKINEYRDFKTYLDSEDVKRKLENGTLTVEDLEKNGAPEEVIADLKDGQFRERDIYLSGRRGLADLESEVASKYSREGSSYASLDGKGIKGSSMVSKFEVAAAGHSVEAPAIMTPQAPAPATPAQTMQPV